MNINKTFAITLATCLLSATNSTNCADYYASAKQFVANELIKKLSNDFSLKRVEINVEFAGAQSTAYVSDYSSLLTNSFMAATFMLCKAQYTPAIHFSIKIPADTNANIYFSTSLFPTFGITNPDTISALKLIPGPKLTVYASHRVTADLKK